MKRREKFLFQKRSLSQVFLTADWPLRRVVEKLEQLKVSRVIEVGPGGGVLTKALLGAGFQVTAIEKDDRFAEKLIGYRATLPNPQTLEVINEDVLRYDFGKWIAQSGTPSAIVGNIPYNISSPLLMQALNYIQKVRAIIFMTQLEFAQRLVAAASTKDYGSLSVFVQLRAKAQLECVVNRTCFHPIPKVDSAIVVVQSRSDRLSEEILRRVELVTRAAFTQRRKILSNSLSAFIAGRDGQDLPIDLNRRADSLTPEEFVVLAEALTPPSP